MTSPNGETSLMDETLFQNQIHALGLIDPVVTTGGHTHEEPLLKVKSIQNKTQFLDQVALLLEFKNGEAAAVGLWETSELITCLWSKTDGTPVAVDSGEDAYIDRLIKMLVDKESIQKLAKHVIPKCRARIVSKCQLLAKVPELNPQKKSLFDFMFYRKRYDTLGEKLKNKRYIPHGTRIPDLFNEFARNVAAITENSQDFDLEWILKISFGLLHFEPSIIVGGKILKGMQELALYRQVLFNLRRRISSLNRTVEIKAEHVHTPCPRTIQVHTSAIAELKHLASVHKNIKHPGFTPIAKHSPAAQTGPLDQTHGIRPFEHPPLSVAIRMLVLVFQNHYARGLVEIGSSKPVCYWCQCYLTALNSTLGADTNIAVTRRKAWKKQVGWALPHVFSEAAGKIRDFAQEECRKFLEREQVKDGSWVVGGLDG